MHFRRYAKNGRVWKSRNEDPKESRYLFRREPLFPQLPPPAKYQTAGAVPPCVPTGFFQQLPELPGGLKRGTINLLVLCSPNSPAAARGYPFLFTCQRSIGGGVRTAGRQEKEHQVWN